MGRRARIGERCTGLVFLCSGNMVRSAFAELWARHLGCPLPVRSAATTYRNDRIFPETARALLARGVDADGVRRFRPTHWDDLEPGLDPGVHVLGMRWHHLEALGEPWRARACLLLGDVEIADPVLEGADFDATFAAVAEGVETLLAELTESRSGP